MVIFLCVFLLLVAGVAIAKLAERASEKHSVDLAADDPTEKTADAKSASTKSTGAKGEKSAPVGSVRYSMDHEKKNQNKPQASPAELVPLFHANEASERVWVCPYCSAENEMERTQCAVCAKAKKE